MHIIVVDGSTAVNSCTCERLQLDSVWYSSTHHSSRGINQGRHALYVLPEALLCDG